MKRMIGACAVAVLTFGSLTACGGGSDNSSANASDSSSTGDNSGGGIFGGGGTDDYCSAIKDAKDQFGSVNFKAADLGDAVNVIHNLAGQAPDSVSAEWATIDDAFSQLISALADAGLDPSDLGDPTAMQSLASDPQKLQELENITKSFNSKDLTQAGNKIDAEVKADCGFALSSPN